jgi:hypothetical protein
MLPNLGLLQIVKDTAQRNRRKYKKTLRKLFHKENYKVASKNYEDDEEMKVKFTCHY